MTRAFKMCMMCMMTWRALSINPYPGSLRALVSCHVGLFSTNDVKYDMTALGSQPLR
jgi:hypothetical protein